ncbi:MAG TPA: UbiD family decarboxylase [Burkholderiales bacterium]|nr:UbiD family decarboxylase [Burkholderiales bacterium]
MRDYLQSLGAAGDIAEVAREVDPRFELAAVTRAAQRAGDRAVLFRKVRGSRLPVVTNVYGSRRRLLDMIGAKDGRFAPRFAELCENLAPVPSLTVETQRVEGSLLDLPQIVYHERDGGPYLTAAIFLAREPDSGVANLSFHRSMICGERELRVRLGGSHDLAGYQAKAEKTGKALEAAILVGSAPEVFLAACASLPYEADEMAFAARLRGAPVPLERCRTIDLAVPADTEVLIEGRFLPNLKRPEGPFGEFMGYYVPVGDNHVFEVTRVAWRKDAVFHSILCQSPEDIYPLEYAIATRIYRMLRTKVPGLLDVACKSSLLATVLQLRPQYEGHVREALHAAVASHTDYNKLVIAVDDDVDPTDYEDVLWAYLTRGRADTRATILHDVPGFYRDPMKDHWGRLLIDATRPWGREREFERKRIPGQDDIDLGDYLA